MQSATDPVPQAAVRRLLPILLRLVPDPCREWIDSPYPGDAAFRWGEFRYCRQRREDGLTVFIGLEGRDVPDRFAAEKVAWEPWRSPEESHPNVGREFELWCAAVLKKGETLPPIDGRIPAVGIRSWRGCSDGGGSEPYHVLVEREQVIAHLHELDARDGLRSVRCGVTYGMAALLFPYTDQYYPSRGKLGFRFLILSGDVRNNMSEYWRGLEFAEVSALAANMQALGALLADPEIAALEWHQKGK